MEDFTTPPIEPQEQPKKRGKIITLVCVVVALSLIGGWYYGKHRRIPVVSSSGLPMLGYDDSVRSGRISASDQETLLVVFKFDPAKQPELSVSSLSRYTHGSPDTAVSTGDYKLEVLRDGNVLYTDYFVKPTGQIAESFGDDNKIKGGLAGGAQSVVKMLPWFDDKSTLRISSGDKVIVTKQLTGISVTKNTPKFETVNGEDL